MTNKMQVKSALKKDTPVNYRPQWWLRIVGILVLAFPLALGLAGLFAFLAPGPITNDAKTQLAMWMITPLVLLALSLIFFSKNLLRTYIGLLSMNGAAYLLLWFIKEGF